MSKKIRCKKNINFCKICGEQIFGRRISYCCDGCHNISKKKYYIRRCAITRRLNNKQKSMHPDDLIKLVKDKYDI